MPLEERSMDLHRHTDTSDFHVHAKRHFKTLVQLQKYCESWASNSISDEDSSVWFVTPRGLLNSLWRFEET